jgi:hypothetical protein
VIATVLLIAGLALAAAAPAPAPASACRCATYADELAQVEKAFAARGAAARVPLTRTAHLVFGTRVNHTYLAAECLAACEGVPEPARNPARRLLAAAAYKSRDLELPEKEIKRRLETAADAMKRCLALEPADPECLTWHASARGRLAAYSWNPLLVGLPRSLLAEFRAARGTLAPGRDLRDGAATRGEASVLMRAPILLGGDATAARLLLESAMLAPEFPCSITNRALLAEARTRTGDAVRGLAELRETAAAGLPSCADQRYENAVALAEVQRCLARIDADPALVTTWPDECE